MTAAIDLAQLPAPTVVEALSFEAIFSAMLTDLKARDPQFNALVESDPAYKILQVAAWREMLIRQRVNDAARASMLAYATGADLDQLAANFRVTRQIVTPANPNTIPPAPAVYETDARLRERVLLKLESISTAGPANGYKFHALSASPSVKDVAIIGPTTEAEAGRVRVVVLSTAGNGVPDSALLATVEASLNGLDVRPLTDKVIMEAAAVSNYTVQATLYYKTGPDPAVVRAAVNSALAVYVNERHRIGADVTISGLYAALHQPGVSRVDLAQPVANIVTTATQAPYCTSITLTDGGVYE